MELKKFRRFLAKVLVISMAAVMVTGCEKEQESAAEEPVEVIELENDAEDQEAPEESDQDVEMVVETEEQPEEEIYLTEEEAEEFILPLTQWAGLYLTGMLDKTTGLDDTLKFEIAGVSVAYGCLPEVSSESMMAEEVAGTWTTAPEGYLYVDADKVQEAVDLLFTQPIERMDSIALTVFPEETDSMCVTDGEGAALVWAGDWGLIAPRGFVASVDHLSGSLNRITVSYVLYDWEMDMPEEEIGIIEYYVRSSSVPGESPKIEDMDIEILHIDSGAYFLENWEGENIVYQADDYTLELPQAWTDRYYAYQQDNVDFFVCSASAEENYTGMLFAIARIPSGVNIEEPSYQILGEYNHTTYIAVFPTDVEFDPDNAYSAKEYTDMSSYIDAILSTVSLGE